MCSRVAVEQERFSGGRSQVPPRTDVLRYSRPLPHHKAPKWIVRGPWDHAPNLLPAFHMWRSGRQTTSTYAIGWGIETKLKSYDEACRDACVWIRWSWLIDIDDCKKTTFLIPSNFFPGVFSPGPTERSHATHEWLITPLYLHTLLFASCNVPRKQNRTAQKSRGP